METRMTEFGSKRYSFPLGHKDPESVLRIFERDNRLSFHFVAKKQYFPHMKPSGKKMVLFRQTVLSVRNDKLYCYNTIGRESIHAIPIDMIPRTAVSINRMLMNQSSDSTVHYNERSERSKRVSFGSISCVKKLTYNFLRSQLSWYPEVNLKKNHLADIMILGFSPLLADMYKYEGIRILAGPKKDYRYSIDRDYSNVLRHTRSLRELAKKVFGFSSAWAIREAKNCLLNGEMPMSYIVKGLIPVDYIKQLPLNSQGPYLTTHKAGFRKFLRQYHPDTILKWLTDRPLSEYGIPYRQLFDAIYIWNRLPEELRVLPRNTTDIREIHDHYSMVQRKMEQSDFKLNINKRMEKIDKHIINNMQLVVPKTNYELIEWGNKMSNCIASYARRSSSELLGIKENGELKYCIEIHNNTVMQFKAKYNASAPEGIVKTVCEYLKKNEVIKHEGAML
jgi:hypothetical protein